MADERRARRELVRERINAGDIQGFLDAHLGQNARHGAGEQRFARTGTPDEKYVMDKKPYTFQ